MGLTRAFVQRRRDLRLRPGGMTSRDPFSAILSEIREERLRLIQLGQEPVSIVLPLAYRSEVNAWEMANVAMTAGDFNDFASRPRNILGMVVYYMDVDRAYAQGRWPS